MAVTDTFQMARRTGLFDPRQTAAMGAAFLRWGPTLATAYAAAALRHPGRAAVVDHRGSVTFAELDTRSTALAHGLRAQGLRQGQHLGILCHNHRDFVEATIAAAKAGLRVVYLNTGFAAPQLAEVVTREKVAGLVCDADLASIAEASGFSGPVIVADVDVDADAAGNGDDTDVLFLDRVRRRWWQQLCPLVPRPTVPVLLTSGTTGTPKGAQRRLTSVDAGGVIGLLERIPYQKGDVFVIPCPLFHAWGLGQLVIAATLGSTVVLIRQFDADATLRAVEEHAATVLAVVPIMLQRLLVADALEHHDLSSLRIVGSSGSALPASVALEWMDRVGDTLYNLYGSTEVGQATIATPADLRDAPGTAGRAVRGSTVAILDEHGEGAPDGSEGRIFVGNGGQFREYTGGGTRETIRGLMATGDVGYLDADARLTVTGRSDDMIVSGGENVYPGEIEDLLLTHPAVVDVAVVGVPDPEFGQRLAAFIVLRRRHQLSDTEVRELVGHSLARHKVPRDVHFLDELPRTVTGKLIRRKLVD